MALFVVFWGGGGSSGRGRGRYCGTTEGRERGGARREGKKETKGGVGRNLVLGDCVPFIQVRWLPYVAALYSKYGQLLAACFRSWCCRLSGVGLEYRGGNKVKRKRASLKIDC